MWSLISYVAAAPPKLCVDIFHLYVWGDQSSAWRPGPDELLDEGDEDVDDDGQGDWDDEEQDLPLHHPLVRRRVLKTWSQSVRELLYAMQNFDITLQNQPIACKR